MLDVTVQKRGDGDGDHYGTSTSISRLGHFWHVPVYVRETYMCVM